MVDCVKEKHRSVWHILNVALILVFCAILSGCGGTPVWLRDDPADVVKGYLQAVESQDENTVWEFLSEQTRQKLDQSAEKFNQNPASGAPRKGKDMLRFGHVISSTREYKKIVLSTKDDNHAVVNIVLHDETTHSVELIRESDRWAIALPLDRMDIK